MFPSFTSPNRLWLARLRPMTNLLSAVLGLVLAASVVDSAVDAVSLAAFDRKARQGGEINVVFFGGSLTWGANSTDPERFSYRALITEKLRTQYPAAHLRSWDAAIGGTGSQLGIFRLERDVLSHKPDLVFLEFTVNDTPRSEERLASYEAIVRTTLEAKCPIMIVILPVRQDVLSRASSVQHRAHENIAEAYNCPFVDVTPYIADRVENGSARLEDIWPDPSNAHPVNLGYKLYADAIWESFLKFAKEEKTASVPQQLLHSPTYLHTIRRRLAAMGSLPQGWTLGEPDRVASNYDWLMSRWLDSIVIVGAGPDPGSNKPGVLECQFNGSTVLLFGEATLKSGKYRVLIDGKPSEFKDGKEPGVFDASAIRFGGNAPHVRVLAQGLAEGGVHSLRIEPLLSPTEELRLESLCVAGTTASLL
jgi:lysophospholipase L1-like esterase